MDAGSGSRDGGVGVICCRIDDTSLGDVCTVSDVTVMSIKEHVTCHQMQCDSGVIAVVLRASPIACRLGRIRKAKRVSDYQYPTKIMHHAGRDIPRCKSSVRRLDTVTIYYHHDDCLCQLVSALLHL